MKTIIIRRGILFVAILLLAGHFAAAQKKKVALLPISYNETTNFSNVEKATLKGALRSGLASSNKYELLTRTDYSDILDEAILQSSRFIDDQQRTEIGEMLGADYICLTKLTKETDCFYIESYLIDILNGYIASYASLFKKISSNTSLDIWDQIMRELIAELIRYDNKLKENDDNLKDIVNGNPIPFQLVQEQPLFFGCSASSFSQWINERLVYPEIAKENGVQGRVTVQFTVEEDGSVTNVKVIHSVDPSLDEEAVRVVSMSPKWKPGRQRNREVPVTYTFPIIFGLR